MEKCLIVNASESALLTLYRVFQLKFRNHFLRELCHINIVSL